MKKYDKKMNQKLFNDEKYMREHAHTVHAPRLETEGSKARAKVVPKQKGMNTKGNKGNIPLM